MSTNHHSDQPLSDQPSSDQPSSDQPSSDQNGIGDQNIERLLASSYQPETLDPAFVARVRQLAHSEAQRKRDSGSSRIVSGAHRIWQQRSWHSMAATAVIVLLTVAVYRLTRDDGQETGEFYRDGNYVWVDGQPFVRTDSATSGGNGQPQSAGPNLRPVADRNIVPPIGGRGLVPRKRTKVATPRQLAAGEIMTTGPGERQHVTLADGSQLYVNENASLKVDNDRKITVNAGEVFVAVAPVDGGSKDAVGQQPTFVVKTPDREVTAWGTKFAVKVDDNGTGVLVTQGKVQVSGIEPMIQAGQQLHPDPTDDGNALNIAPLPQVSYVLGWMRDLITAAESPLVPGSEYRGGALVAVDPNGQQVKLSLRKYHVDVHIEDGFARTTIDQTYFNHRPNRLEGTFYFPLPADASISRLAMYVNGRLMEGGMAERDHARNVFETIKTRQLDPALLEWIDGSTFKMRVFPLEGRQEKRIVLSYTQKLDNHYGQTQYRFPAGHNMDAVGSWSVKVHVVNGAAMNWKCSSHDLIAATKDEDLTLTGSKTNARLDRDILVSLNDEQDDAEPIAAQARFSSVQHDGAQYLMVRWRPDLPAAAQQQRRDWVFLLDADGSRDPLLARVQVDIVRTLLENAGHDDTFSILTAGTRVRAFAAEQKLVTPDNVAAAVEFLDTTHLIGALDLQQAFVAARGFAQAAQAPTLVHIGSGFPVLGERSTDSLLAELPEDIPYVGVAVGKRWNRNMMRAAADRSSGLFTQINPDEPTQWRALELLSTLSTPRLMGLRVAADQEQCEFLLVANNVAHGEELCAIARLDADQAKVRSVTITGTLGTNPMRHLIPVESIDEGANYLPRMWAKLAIDDMVTRDAKGNKAAIVELSKSMYVMSPFTSLLVLENDAMYDQYDVDRGRKDHWALYPCPEKIDVVHEPVEGPQQSDQPDKDTSPAKPSPAEVLRTLLVRTAQGDHPIGSSHTSKTIHLRNGDTVGPFTFSPVSSTIRVPDGGTVLLGGIRRLVNPTVGKLPYINRLFTDNFLFDHETPLMMMVTPRIIIQEEEERLITVGEDLSRQTLGRFQDGDGDLNGVIDSLSFVTPPNSFDAWGTHFIRPTESLQEERRLLASRVYRLWDLAGPKTNPSAIDVPYTLAKPVWETKGIPQINLQSLDFSLNRHDGFSQTFREIEQLALPFANEPPIAYPDARFWRQISSDRRKYIHKDLLRQPATANDQILAKLDERANFNYQDASLHDIVDDLHERLTVPVTLHTEAIEQSRTGVDKKRLTLSLKKITIRSALRVILDKFGLTFYLEDKTLQITTPSDFQQHLALRSRWLDETLLIFAGDRTLAPKPEEPSNKGRRRDTTGAEGVRIIDRWSQRLLRRESHGGPDATLLYPTLHSSSDANGFRNLTAFAPAIGTTLEDILAVLESEAELKNRPRLGTIDESAKTLIDAARNGGWQLMTRDDSKITFDGRGRFRCDRKTEYGLSETIICDGITLRHLYRELGLGTTRTMSRFHRQNLTRLMPWLVPLAEDLAVGADVRLIGPRTVAIVPHGADDAKNEQGQPRPYLRLHLLFASDGRLAERQLVELPSGTTKARMAFAHDRSVQCFVGEDTLVTTTLVTAEASSQPDLTPKVDELVVLPMPIRDRGHVLATVRDKRAKPNVPAADIDPLKKIIHDQKQSEQDDPIHWSDEEVLRLLSACLWQDSAELRNLVGRRFFARGDRRVGFYSLLLSSGQVWSLKQPVQLGDKTTTRMDPVKDHPHSRLARYIQRELEAVQNKLADTRGKIPMDINPFIEQLSEYRQLCAEWSLVRELSSDVEVRHRSLDRLFEFVTRCDSARSAYVLLRRVQRRLGNDQPHGRIAEAIIELEKRGVTSYVVKYELARSLAATGRKLQARTLFVDLYRESLDAGILPLIDRTFVDTLKGSDANPFGPGTLSEKGFAGFMHAVCKRLAQHKQRPTAIALAWQCRKLGQTQLADRLFDQAIAGVDQEQLTATLSAVSYLLLTKDYDRAIATFTPLLTHADYGRSSSLWWLAARVAENGGRLAQAVRYAETALDLEYHNMPKRYNVEYVREKYGQLFQKYQQLAKLTTVAGEAAPSELICRSIQAADRWRTLDSDMTRACQQASGLLASVGLEELAWDYLTTPLALKPNEAAPWLELAGTLGNEKQYGLASRAYASAYDIEPTNAQILWDHAQILERAGRADESQTLYDQIARGKWQPRFQTLQRRSQRIMAATTDN